MNIKTSHLSTVLPLMVIAILLIIPACTSASTSMPSGTAMPTEALPIAPSTDPTKITLEMEATSMSIFITQQAATLQAPQSPDPTKFALEIEATGMSAFVTQQAATMQAATLQAIQPHDQIYPIVVYPPYDSPSGYLVGGSQNGDWLDATSTAALLKGGEQYALYAAHTFLGASTGSLPVHNPPHCAAWQEITLNPKPPFNIVALGSNWNALPRDPQEIATDNEIYRQVILDLLQANGITQPEVRLNRVLKIDLEGDGVDEVLISATRFVSESGLKTNPGDYSMVVLRKVTGNTVTSIPIVADYYPPQSQPVEYPNMYVLNSVLDLNGDGKMEIVLGITGWEKTGTLVYEIEDTTIREILKRGC